MRTDPSPEDASNPLPAPPTARPPRTELQVSHGDFTIPSEQTALSSSTASLDQFSATAQRILSVAREHARDLGHAEIQPEHLLVALLLDQSSAVARPMLRVVGSSREELVELRESLLRRLRDLPPAGAGEPALSEACKHVLQLALAEALRLRRPTRAGVEPVHLLVGLVSEGSATRDTALATKLALRGLRMSVGTSPWRQPPMPPGSPMLHQVQGGLQTGVGASSETATRDNVITLRVTDADLAAVDALVEVGAMRTRSEASAWLLQSGIVANQPFFDQIRSIHEEVARLRQEVQRLVAAHVGRQPSAAAEPGSET